MARYRCEVCGPRRRTIQINLLRSKYCFRDLSPSIGSNRKSNITPCFRESFLSTSIANYRRPAESFDGITYRLSCLDLVAVMAEREIAVSHTTVMRWVLRYRARAVATSGGPAIARSGRRPVAQEKRVAVCRLTTGSRTIGGEGRSICVWLGLDMTCEARIWLQSACRDRLLAGRPVNLFLGRRPYAAAQSDRGRHDMLHSWGPLARIYGLMQR